MFSYLQMPFLQALGYAIANSIWQVFLLWLIVLLVNVVAKSSHIRYVTALSAQVAGFVWFLTTFQFYYRHCHAASLQAEQLADGTSAIYIHNAVAGNNLLSVLVRTEETLPYLSLAYLLLLLYLVAKWIQNVRFTRLLYTNGLQTADSKWQAFVNETADKLSIMQDVKIYLSSIAKGPLTVGYLKPIILLPVASLTHLTTEQLEAVILHELAHIKRSDYIINMLVSIAEMILFFNPFTRLLSRAIQKERENCCDDWVLQYQYNAGMYAEALLRIACLQQHGFQMSAATQPKGELLQRVKRMIQPAEKKFSYRYQATAMLFIATLLFCMAWMQPGENDYRKATVLNSQKEDKKVMIAPMMAQVDNPFFNGASLLSSSLHDDVMQQLAELDETIADSSAMESLHQAQKALKKITPVVAATISSSNWQNFVKEAAKNAGKDLQSTETSFADMPVIPFADSVFFAQTINDALAKTDYESEIQKGFEAAGKEFQKLKLSNDSGNGLSFSFDNLNQLGANALSSLQNIRFEAIKDSITAASEKIRSAAIDRAEKVKERKIRQVMILKQIQDSRNRFVAATNRKGTPKIPSLPPTPEQAPDINIEVPDSPIACAEVSNNMLPASYSWSYSAPSAESYTNLQSYKAAKTIHITKSSDKVNVNITIEIRQ